MKLNVSKMLVLLLVILFVITGTTFANAAKAKQYLGAGVKYLKAKQYSKAVQYLKYSIKMKKSANTYYYLGLAYLGQKKKSQALSNFQKALKLNPSHRQAKSMVSKLRGGKGGGNPAQKYLIMGHKYFKARRFAQAINYYKKSAQIRPSYQAYQFMGTAYYKQGDKANALKAYQRSLSINPNNPRVAKMVKHLKGSGAGEARLGEQLGVHPLLLAVLFAGALAVLLLF